MIFDLYGRPIFLFDRFGNPTYAAALLLMMGGALPLFWAAQARRMWP